MNDFHPVYPDIVGLDPYKRVRYSMGMVLGIDEFLQEELHMLEKHRSHHRGLHGYGTVCGLSVINEIIDSVSRIKVSPGIAINPQGNNIRVTEAKCATINNWLNDNRDEIIDFVGSPVVSPFSLSVYLKLCYGECETDFAPIPSGPCLSLDRTQVPTRIADDFAFILSLEPPQHVEELAIRDLLDLLAQIEIRDQAGGLSMDNIACLVRNLLSDGSPMVCDPPLGGMHMRPSEAETFMRAALRTWITEVRPALLDAGRNCVNGPPDETCVLLARFDMDVSDTVDGLLVDNASVVVNEDERPFLMQSRILQEWFINRANAQVAHPYISPAIIHHPTRIVSSSWEHNMPWDMRISIDGVDRDGVIIEFGDGQGAARAIDVSTGSLDANSFQVYVDRQYSSIMTPVELIPLKELAYDGRFVVGGNTISTGEEPIAAAFIIAANWINYVRTYGSKVRVVIRGDFVRDSSGEVIDAHFINAMLPTGASPFDLSVGLRGGVFESWFYGTTESLSRELLSINSATRTELVTLPGVNVSLAERIIAERENVGGFRTVDDLVTVRGISERMLRSFRDRIRT